MRIHTGGVVLDSHGVYGMPTAKIIVQWLLRVMVYNEAEMGRGSEQMEPQEKVKPAMIKVSWRMNNEFEAVQAAMAPFGIQCFLQSEEENRLNCERSGTSVQGFNHNVNHL